MKSWQRDLGLGLRHAAVELACGRRLLAAVLLLGLVFLVGTLEHRVDASLASSRSLAAVVGLVLPLLVLIMTPRATPDGAASLLGRHGAHRRWLLGAELTLSLLICSGLTALAIASVRTITSVPTDRYLASDIVTCVGIGLLGVVGYWGWLAAVGLWGRGLFAPLVLLVADFWVGHVDGVPALFTVRGHLRNLLFGIEGIHLAPAISSYILLGMGLLGSSVAWLRTRP